MPRKGSSHSKASESRHGREKHPTRFTADQRTNRGPRHESDKHARWITEHRDVSPLHNDDARPESAIDDAVVGSQEEGDDEESSESGELGQSFRTNWCRSRVLGTVIDVPVAMWVRIRPPIICVPHFLSDNGAVTRILTIATRVAVLERNLLG